MKLRPSSIATGILCVFVAVAAIASPATSSAATSCETAFFSSGQKHAASLLKVLTDRSFTIGRQARNSERTDLSLAIDEALFSRSRPLPLSDVRDLTWAVFSQSRQNLALLNSEMKTSLLFGYLSRISLSDHTELRPAKFDLTDWLQLVREYQLTNLPEFADSLTFNFESQLARAVQTTLGAGGFLGAQDLNLMTALLRTNFELRKRNIAITLDGTGGMRTYLTRDRVADNIHGLIAIPALRHNLRFRAYLHAVITYLRMDQQDARSLEHADAIEHAISP